MKVREFKRLFGVKPQSLNYGGKNLFDFDFSDNTPTYRNKGGNCFICAICDVLNDKTIIENKYIKKYMPRNKYNLDEFSLKYSKVARLNRINTNCDVKLKDFLNCDYNGIVGICCKGGYHEIAIIHGKIKNNWANRELQTLDSFLNEIGYSKAPRVWDYCNIGSMAFDDLVRECLELGLIYEV